MQMSCIFKSAAHDLIYPRLIQEIPLDNFSQIATAAAAIWNLQQMSVMMGVNEIPDAGGIAKALPSKSGL